MTTASRFVLLLIAASVLEPFQVGLLGLLFAAVSFGVLLIGADYYTFTQRELACSPPNRWIFILWHQVCAIVFTYALALPPLVLILSYWPILPDPLIPWLFVLLPLEHLGQEVNRALIGMRRPLIAAWVLFIRGGAWVWILAPLMWTTEGARSLSAILFAWSLGSGASLVIGSAAIYKQVSPFRRVPLNYQWLFRGFRVGAVLLAASLSFRALQTLDRYLLEALAAPDLLGVYVFYSGIAMTGANLSEPVVFSFIYPRMIAAYERKELSEYRLACRDMILSAVTLNTCFVILLTTLSPAVFNWTGREIYTQHMPVFWLLVVAGTVSAMGMIPHYALYSMRADFSILAAHGSSLLVFLFTTSAASHVSPLLRISIAVLSSFVWIGVFKSAALWWGGQRSFT